jgi:hypothetical protein
MARIIASMDDIQRIRAMQAEIQLMIDNAKEAVRRLTGEPEKTRHGSSNAELHPCQEKMK